MLCIDSKHKTHVDNNIIGSSAPEAAFLPWGGGGVEKGMERLCHCLQFGCCSVPDTVCK